MEEYKLTLGMEPTDDYKKCKAGFDSGNEINSKNLSPQQQQMLAEELFGAANVMVFESNTTPVSEVNIKYVRVYKR